MVNSRASQLASDYITSQKATEYSLQGTENKVSWDEVGIKRNGDYLLGLELDAPVTEADVEAISTMYGLIWYISQLMKQDERGSNKDLIWFHKRYLYELCGAYILTDWVPGSVFKMKRNPDYVLSDMIKLDEYVYKVVADKNTALELYLNGEMDEVTLSPEAIEQYVDDPSIKTGPAKAIQVISINHGNTNNNGILGNVNFRKALFYAVDRQSIAKMTNGIPANYLVPSKCLGLDGKTYREMSEAQEYLADNFGYDPKLAKEYYDKAMAECGISNLTLTLQYNETSANNKAASEFLHKTFPEIFGDSFTLELMAAPSGVLNSYIKGWKNR